MEPSPVSRLDIEVVSAPEGLRLLGDIDSHTAPSLEEALSGLDSGGDVTLDMAGVEFIDSTGLRVLVAEHQNLDSEGRKLVLSKPSDAVSRLLDMTGLAGTLHTAGPPAAQDL